MNFLQSLAPILSTHFPTVVSSVVLGVSFSWGSNMLYWFQRMILSVFRRWLMVSLEVTSKDESYSCLTEWLNEHEYTKHAKNLMVETTYYRSEDLPVQMFTPCIGGHWLTYKNKWIWLQRDREEQVDIALGHHSETITLSAISTNKNLFRDLIYEAVRLSQQKTKGKVVIHSCTDGSWRTFGQPEEPRPLHSIILRAKLKENILADIDKFIKAKSWYKALGIPYRRGYLFYGPPGCGKSSFIKALAGHYGFGICLVNLNSRDISDDSLNVLLNEAPMKSFVVIEDIDAAMGSREDTSNDNNPNQNGRLTLSGLLNALDGIASQEGRLLFMTTNKKKQLDPALIRPGRIDRKAYFGFASVEQLKGIFRLFFPDAHTSLSEHFASLIPPNTYSMAEIQKFLMLFRESPTEAIANATNINEISEDGETTVKATEKPAVNGEKRVPPAKTLNNKFIDLTEDGDWFSKQQK